jgi:glutaredoxin
MSVVELWGKPDCCLCDDARAALERVREDHPFELVERDIEADEEAHRAYFERIPVIVVDGQELFAFRVDESVLRAVLGSSASVRGAVDDLESGQ